MVTRLINSFLNYNKKYIIYDCPQNLVNSILKKTKHRESLAIFQISIPSLKPILTSCFCRICCLYNPTANNYDIAASLRNDLKPDRVVTNLVDKLEYLFSFQNSLPILFQETLGEHKRKIRNIVMTSSIKKHGAQCTQISIPNPVHEVILIVDRTFTVTQVKFLLERSQLNG